MELISSAKSTYLSSFEKLETQYVYHHVENEPRDFHFFGKQKLFLEVNKKSGFEMLCIKNPSGNLNEILRIRKMKVDNLYCTACPKQSTDIVALGLSNGQVRLLNYRNTEYTAKFPAERSSVIFMDFNASDEYLSSVFESGIINLYGLKTKTKLETLNFDKNSTLAKFHPTKRFHLSVASYTGAVYIYDIQSKRKIFQTIDSHGAPCRDLCTSSATPDILLSVGYDCILNIFDTRRKLSPQQIRGNHPLSSICISDCGRFCCAGNLKGELISYDLRNLKSCLKTNLVHDSAVVRVSFVPHEDGYDLSSLELSGNVLTETQNLPVDDNIGKPRRDSFFDFINSQSFKGRETLLRRDSFNLPAFERKENDFDLRESVDGSRRRSGIGARISMDLKSINNILSVKPNNETQNENFNNKIKSHRISSDYVLTDKKSKSNIIDELIEEEAVFEEVDAKKLCESVDCTKDEEKKLEISSDENKEMGKENNLENHSRKELDYLKKLPSDKNSTPNPMKKSISNVIDEAKKDEEEPAVNGAELKAVLAEIKDLRNEMNDKLKVLETEIKFHADVNKSDFYMQNFNLWKHQMEISEDIKTMIMGMLHVDPFVMEFIKLQEENEKLKETIKSLRTLR